MFLKVEHAYYSCIYIYIFIYIYINVIYRVPIHARTCRQDQIYREVPMNKHDMYKSMISGGPTLCGVPLFIFRMLSCSSKKLVAKPSPDIPIIAPGTRLVVKGLMNFLKGQ